MKRIAGIAAILILSAAAAGCSVHGAGDGGGSEKENAGMKNSVIEKKDRVDDWTAAEEINGEEKSSITLMPSNAEPIKISFEEHEDKGHWESYTGGAEADYALAAIEGEAPDAALGIMDGFNEWVKKTEKDELLKAKERWDLYHSSDPDSYIALTPWVGIKLKRSDTSLISFAAFIKRYNRDYEPDDDFIYGHTYDAQSGKELRLTDLVSDTDKLTDALIKSLEIKCSGYSEEKKEIYLDEGFQKRVRESISGCRDDGHFAWCVSPDGFVFYLTDPFYREDYLYYQVEEIFVPFRMCEGFTGQDLEASYDFISSFPNYCLKEIYGSEGLPDRVGGKTWYTPYSVKKDGVNYIYLSGDNELQTYRAGENSLVYVGSITGGIAYDNHYTYESLTDPENIEMDAEAYLLVEFLNLRAYASIGADGMPEYKGLFTPEYGVMPMAVIGELEAEVFADENAEKSEKKTLKPYKELFFVRTDAETFIDLEIEGSKEICRLYIAGNDEEGFTVNGRPAKEVIQEEVIYEE